MTTLSYKRAAYYHNNLMTRKPHTPSTRRSCLGESVMNQSDRYSAHRNHSKRPQNSMYISVQHVRTVHTPDCYVVSLVGMCTYIHTCKCMYLTGSSAAMIQSVEYVPTGGEYLGRTDEIMILSIRNWFTALFGRLGL